MNDFVKGYIPTMEGYKLVGYSLTNMRQLKILFNQAKSKLVDFYFFTIFCELLQHVITKLFSFDLQNNFIITSGKNTKINKQSDVKFWLN